MLPPSPAMLKLRSGLEGFAKRKQTHTLKNSVNIFTYTLFQIQNKI